MVIRTIDEYRAYISRPSSTKSMRSKGTSKYFEAAFRSAATEMREERPKRKTHSSSEGEHDKSQASGK